MGKVFILLTWENRTTQLMEVVDENNPACGNVFSSCWTNHNSNSIMKFKMMRLVGVEIVVGFT